MIQKSVLFVLIWSFGVLAYGQQMNLPPDLRNKYYNTDGSCVQCSIGMVGLWNNNQSAASLLWNTEFGPAVRGGSSPSRVASYATARKIPIYNITGNTEPWIEWALMTGRGCGGTWDYSHMVAFVGMTPDRQHFAICNNQTPRKIEWYDRATFYRRHRVDGTWVVILKNQAPTPSPSGQAPNVPNVPTPIHW